MARKRVGHTYQHLNFSQLHWLKNHTLPEISTMHCVEENVALLKFFGVDNSRIEAPAMQVYLNENERDAGRKYRLQLRGRKVVGVHTGTNTFKGHARRRWAKERFVECFNAMPDIHFLLFGTGDEIAINAFIRENVAGKGMVTVVEGTTLREVASIIGCCDAFLSNDSGLMHLAAAMNVPVVALLGPTNPVFIHPWRVRHEIVRLDLPCSPCFYYSPRPLRCSLNNSFKCMVELPVSSVVEALKRILDD